MVDKQRSLTGIKPSGTIHLGNYLGAIRPALDLAKQHDALYFIADYHALTTMHDRELMRQFTYEVAASWLACGLDPNAVTIFRQSDIPEIFELAWVLSCFCGKGWLNRAHAYKAAVHQNEEAGRDFETGISAGLFTYPVLMASDIVLYDSDIVPVGADQRQHVEIARDIALAVNHVYGDRTLRVPEVSVQDDVMTVVGLDGRKMSKSYNNVIPLFAPPKKLRKIVMSIQTDSKTVEDPKDPETCNVFALYKLFADGSSIDALAQRYRAGGMGYGEAKQELFDAIEAEIGPMREIYDDLMADTSRIDGILEVGAARARIIGMQTMQRCRDAIGIGVPGDAAK